MVTHTEPKPSMLDKVEHLVATLRICDVTEDEIVSCGWSMGAVRVSFVSHDTLKRLFPGCKASETWLDDGSTCRTLNHDGVQYESYGPAETPFVREVTL